MSAKPVLSLRQTRFIAAYMVTRNAAEAARACGACKTKDAQQAAVRGWEMLQHPVIAAEIEKRMKIVLARADVSVERILQGLYAEATFYGEGASHGARVSAWRELGRYQQMFVDRVEHEHKHKFEEMSPDELRYQIATLLEKARNIAVAPKPEAPMIDVTPAVERSQAVRQGTLDAPRAGSNPAAPTKPMQAFPAGMQRISKPDPEGFGE